MRRRGKGRGGPGSASSLWSWACWSSFMIGRTVLSGFGTGAVDVTGQGGNPEGQTKSASPKPTVEINGSGVPASAGPVAVLNPGLARPGATVGVNAAGFDAGATVEVLLVRRARCPTGRRGNRRGRHERCRQYRVRGPGRRGERGSHAGGDGSAGEQRQVRQGGARVPGGRRDGQAERRNGRPGRGDRD